MVFVGVIFLLIKRICFVTRLLVARRKITQKNIEIEMIFQNIPRVLHKTRQFRVVSFKSPISHNARVLRVHNIEHRNPNAATNNVLVLRRDGPRLKTIDGVDSSVDVKEERIAWSDGICDKLVGLSGPLKPYLKLIRFDKPTGSLLLFWPFGWSVALAANAGCSPDLHCVATFFLVSVILRGAGCTINDMWDMEIDRKVARTKSRPLAKGELTPFQASVFLAGQLGLAFLILQQYNFYTVMLMASSLVLAVSYPLMKKFMPYPQLVLGMAMNFGALLGSPAINGVSDWATCLPLYLGGICWTVVYDTIYAYQDIGDDKKLGLKSTAITFADNGKLWLSGFSVGMISFVSICGIVNDQTWPFYASLALISAHLAKQIYGLNVDNINECAAKFDSNRNIGLILFLGIVFGNLLKSKKNQTDPSQPTEQIDPQIVITHLNETNIFETGSSKILN